jgi:hypothetical protein
LISENCFRIITFLFTFFVQFSLQQPVNKTGLLIFSVGVLLYFSSWLALIIFPDSSWSLSIWGFTAPAYTPFIWLFGLSLFFNSYYFNYPYKYWHFFSISTIFIFFHLWHAIIVYNRVKTM